MKFSAKYKIKYLPDVLGTLLLILVLFILLTLAADFLNG